MRSNLIKNINLYIDESGNLGHGGGNYFLICALEVDTVKAKSLTKRAGRVINRFKVKKEIPRKEELKGWMLLKDDRMELLNKIFYKDIKVRYIVLDIRRTTMLLKKSDDKNACYNYLIQLIVKGLIKDYPFLENITLYLDNRSVKIGNRLSLKPYLYNKLVLEKLEKCEKVKRIDFDIRYMESENCYLIEWADIVANSLYKKYNSNIYDYYNLIKKYIIFESKFPSKTFGKDVDTNNHK